MTKRWTPHQIEALLTDVLVPVEPSETFLRRLQARLVTYRGERALNPWMFIVVGATGVLMFFSFLGLLLRILVGWIGLLGILSLRREAKSGREPTKA